ncbi:ATP-binding cassette domain-containing protein [Mycobacterium camsae]|uniref:ATP-binding cassette domain-containing protein n=1 Tax=Mycobacterium gordonae TaxID=1778 RepID=UPI00197E58CA|nr:ATP-binding cassette domain-containing protein [Mycobacterium gordonae]
MQLLRFLFSISPTRILAVFVTGLVSGVANTYLLTLLNSVLAPQTHSGATLQRFAVTGLVALIGAVLSQILLIRLTQEAIYQLREGLSARVVSAPLEDLERMGLHRLIATLTEDVRSLSQAVTAIPNMCIDVTTIVGSLAFLAAVSGPLFAVTIAGTLISIASAETVLRRVRHLYHEARENEDALLRSFSGLTLGIKELKLHGSRRRDFMARHLLGSARTLRTQNVRAGSWLSAAQGFGQFFQLATMGLILFVVAAALALPRDAMVSYLLVTMFLSRPMQSLMKQIPELLRGDVALAKIRTLNLSIEAAHDREQAPCIERPPAGYARLDLSNLSYAYQSELAPSVPLGPGAPPPRGKRRDHQAGPPPPPGPPLAAGPGFRLGPVDLTFEPGQITFVVGGNGSGKSTLAKLITGLYAPHSGALVLNGEKIDQDNVEWFRQHCAAVFTDFHLFDDCLGFDRPGIDDEVRYYLHQLQIAHKVTVRDGRLSTVALSQGQRKRLALLTALLEDRPIYLFDEWAADQEPRFREVFYTQLLPGLKKRGKTVIVITHDDRYFHCADRLVKLDFGQIAAVTPR